VNARRKLAIAIDGAQGSRTVSCRRRCPRYRQLWAVHARRAWRPGCRIT